MHEAEERAILDPLTGLRNRREFEKTFDAERLSREGGAAAVREPGTLIYVDLDHFKALNDSLGHAAGDSALRHVSGILQAQVRDVDMVARIGGEEFAVWLPRAPLEQGMEIAERMRRAVESSVWRWSGTPAMTSDMPTSVSRGSLACSSPCLVQPKRTRSPSRVRRDTWPSTAAVSSPASAPVAPRTSPE